MFPLQDTIPSRSVPLVTWTIIFINTIAFFYELSIPADERERFVSQSKAHGRTIIQKVSRTLQNWAFRSQVICLRMSTN
jgi:hypothetical protein